MGKGDRTRRSVVWSGCQVVKSRDKYLSRREQTRGIGRIGAGRSPVDHAVEVDAVVEAGVREVDEVTGGDGQLVHVELRGERALWMEPRGEGSVLGPEAHAIWQKRTDLGSSVMSCARDRPVGDARMGCLGPGSHLGGVEGGGGVRHGFRSVTFVRTRAGRCGRREGARVLLCFGRSGVRRFR